MPRDPERSRQMRDERREQILAAALTLFADKGLAATKIAEIAREAGIAQGLVYHYFETKEAIYTAIVGRAMEQLASAALELEKLPLSPREKIATALGRLLEQIAESEEVARRFVLTSQVGVSIATPRQALAIHRKHRDVPYRVVARILRAGQRDGTVRPFDADQMATVFWTTVKGIAMHRVARGKRFVPPDPEILLSALFVDGRSR